MWVSTSKSSTSIVDMLERVKVCKIDTEMCAGRLMRRNSNSGSAPVTSVAGSVTFSQDTVDCIRCANLEIQEQILQGTLPISSPFIATIYASSSACSEVIRTSSPSAKFILSSLMASYNSIAINLYGKLCTQR